MGINYGLQFDLNYEAAKNKDNDNLSKYEEECWSNNKLLALEDALSIRKFNGLRASINSDFKDDYDEDYPETTKWLLACLQSLILSIFLWQPVTVYLTTWIKIWMFSWNLRMELGPGNVIALCKKCCAKNHAENLRKEISYSAQYQSALNGKSAAYYMIAHKTRPLDVIGYFSNDELFLEIDEQTGKLERIKSYNAAGQDDDYHYDKDDKLIMPQHEKTMEADSALEEEDEGEEVEMEPLNSVTAVLENENVNDKKHVDNFWV